MALAAIAVEAADDPAFRALQNQQLQRRQQEDALQLRMRQQEQATSLAPAENRQKQTLEQMHSGQRERQRELHYRQSIEPAAAQPGDDEGTRQAKAGLARKRAELDSQQQLQRMESERPAR